LNHREVVPGRALRSLVAGFGEQLIVWSIHNFGLTAAQIDAVAKMVEADHEFEVGARAVVWTGGDLNFLAE
jgi:hypothetical protein